MPKLSDPRLPRPPFRPKLWALAGVSLVVMLFSGYQLALRIGAYNKQADHPLYYFIETDKTAFEFARREVTITDELAPDGTGEVVFGFGDAELRQPVTIPVEYPLPDFYDRHRDWLRMLIFAEGSGLGYKAFEGKIESGEIAPRLIAVVRTPMVEIGEEGHFDLEIPDNWGWGEVMRNRWAFTFHEFLPEGGWATHTLRYPESGQHFYRRQLKADKAGLPPPVRSDDELHEYTWEYNAALKMMPRTPSITKEQQALKASGWTLPVAFLATLVMMGSIAFAVAPVKRVE